MDDRLCLLVIIGVTEHGIKELVAVEDGFRESTASWEEVLTGLRGRGLSFSPKLAVGDGALGFWGALSKVYPACRHQRCWVHKTANVLNKLPKSMQPKVKEALHDIWMAESRNKAKASFDSAITRFGAKYPQLAMVYKLMESAQKRWKKIKGFVLLTLVVNNVAFKDGVQVIDQPNTKAA